jgi:SpoIIAA-like
MVELREPRGDIIACRIDGTIERRDLNRLFAKIDRKTAQGARLRVYAEIGDLSLMNLIGLSQDLKSWKDRRHLLNQIDKAAVVTDNALVRQALQFKAKVPASLEIRLFSMGERAPARKWIEA